MVKHVAIILDGNRRYAKARGLPAWKGHEEGAKNVDRLMDWCKELGIKEITLYVLSTENLKRDAKELKYLFKLFKEWFKKFKKDKRIHENKIKMRFIGDLSLVPEDVRKLASEIEQDTKNYENYIINFCFAYGGRLELLNAFNKLNCKKGKITEEDVKGVLWLKDEPELIIRTGGMQRTSNFLPWQSVYSEWIFAKKLWPEFSKEDLQECIKEFETRKRNFGK
jgi:undecaprenyl diphosphate synthase